MGTMPEVTRGRGGGLLKKKSNSFEREGSGSNHAGVSFLDVGLNCPQLAFVIIRYAAY